jgi:hypothetical protein
VLTKYWSIYKNKTKKLTFFKINFQVYAKQKGCSFWPAKVIRIIGGDKPEGGSYDVRFFGGYHQRAVVEKTQTRPISVNIHTLQVKRTSLWSKACDELTKHQEFVAKVKAAMPEFLKDPYGDPFVNSEDLRNFAVSTGDSDDEDVNEDDDEELAQLTNNALEEEEGSSMILNHSLPVEQPKLSPAPPAAKIKKKPGRPKKHKKSDSSLVENGLSEREENMVSSSSQEPRVVSIAIQTPSKLLKDLTHHGSSSKATKEEFRQYAEKVRFILLKCWINILTVFFYDFYRCELILIKKRNEL